jgi:hypothetical protein
MCGCCFSRTGYRCLLGRIGAPAGCCRQLRRWNNRSLHNFRLRRGDGRGNGCSRASRARHCADSWWLGGHHPLCFHIFFVEIYFRLRVHAWARGIDTRCIVWTTTTATTAAAAAATRTGCTSGGNLGGRCNGTSLYWCHLWGHCISDNCNRNDISDCWRDWIGCRFRQTWLSLLLLRGA